jgi:hypothetical protein
VWVGFVLISKIDFTVEISVQMREANALGTDGGITFWREAQE